MPCEFKANQKLMSQVPISLTFRKSFIICYQHIVLRYQGFPNNITVGGGGGMKNFAGGRGIVLWVNGNLRKSALEHSNLFQS